MATTTSQDGISGRAAPSLTNLYLGTAPDSWGVWFADDPRQVPWQQFLDEAAAAGYSAIELGPFGYLPTNPHQLRDELERRNLTLTGATAGTALHRGRDSLADALAECRQVAALLSAMDAPNLITLPAMYTDLQTGDLLEPAELTPDQWTTLGQGHSELGRILQHEFGVRQMFHPHADAHVDENDTIGRFLELTDPTTVSLCLDTGHVAYAGGDNLAIIKAFPDRIGYVHLKSVDPNVLTQVREEGMSFAAAVQHGAMVEPPLGIPAMEPLLAWLSALDVPLWAIVEHGLYPATPRTPLPIATRTCRYYSDRGLK